MSAELLWRLGTTAKLGWHDLQSNFPWRVDLSTHMMRTVLQALFFTGIAAAISGEEHIDFAYAGSVAYGTLTYTISMVGDIPMNDRWNSTFYRIRSGVLPVAVTYMIRAWPLLLRVLASNLAVIIITGFIFARYGTMVQLLAFLPLYLLLALTSLPFGLALASLGLFGKRGNDVIFSNLGMYFLMIFAGCLILTDRLGALGEIGNVFPLYHGLEAIRSPNSEIWWTHVGLEILIGITWTAIATIAYTWATWRVRHTDNDKVT